MIAVLLSAALCGTPSAPEASTSPATPAASSNASSDAPNTAPHTASGVASDATNTGTRELTPVVRTVAGVPLSDVDLSDPHDAAHLVLGGGVALTIGSAAAYLAGLEAQRQLATTTHPRDQADALMMTRSINGGISIASLVLGVGALGGGLVWLSQAGPTTAAADATTTTGVSR